MTYYRRRIRDRSGAPDYTTTDGAKALIERIKAHWAEKKLYALPDVKADHPPWGETEGKSRVDIRSDMVNGWPAKIADGEVA